MSDQIATAIARVLLQKAAGDVYDYIKSEYMSDSKAREEASKYCYVFGAKFAGDSGNRMIGVRKSETRIYFDEIHNKVGDAIGHRIWFNGTNIAVCRVQRSDLLPRWDNEWVNFGKAGSGSEDGYTVIDGDDIWGTYRQGKFRGVVGEYNVKRVAAASAATWFLGPVGVIASTAAGIGSVAWNRATKNMVVTSYEIFYAIVYSRCKLVLRSAEILGDRGTDGILIKYEDSDDTSGEDRSVVVAGQFWNKVYVY